MNRAEIERDLCVLIRRVQTDPTVEISLDVDEVQALGLDSLASLRLLAVVERHFDVRFPDHRLGEFRDPQKIIEFIETSTRSEG